MSVEQDTGPDDLIGFLVRPDGTVRGDDGAAGSLAAALPYTGRLARRMGELVDAGDLRLMEAFSPHASRWGDLDPRGWSSIVTADSRVIAATGDGCPLPGCPEQCGKAARRSRRGRSE